MYNLAFLESTLPTESGMANVTTGVTALMEVATSMLDFITANPILCALFAAGFVSIGIGIVRKVKHV